VLLMASNASVKMVFFILMFGFYVNDNMIRLQSYDNNLINAISGVTNTFPYVS